MYKHKFYSFQAWVVKTKKISLNTVHFPFLFCKLYTPFGHLTFYAKHYMRCFIITECPHVYTTWELEILRRGRLSTRIHMYVYEIFSILSSAHAWTSVILEGKRDSRRQPTTSFSENIVVGGTSYQMLEVLSVCYRERA